MRRMAILMVIVLSSTCWGDYLGSWKINDYVTVTATCHQFSTGAALAATGDVHLDIYENDTDVQIVDDTNMAAFDTVTGLYLVKVQLLAATGFEAGKHYTCLISATVDGVAGIMTHNFQILAATDTQTVLGGTPISTGDLSTAADIVAEMDASSTTLAAILTDTAAMDTAAEIGALIGGYTVPGTNMTVNQILSALRSLL